MLSLNLLLLNILIFTLLIGIILNMVQLKLKIIESIVVLEKKEALIELFYNKYKVCTFCKQRLPHMELR